MKKNLLLLSCILVVTFSCKKDTESTAVSITDFTPKQGYAGDNIIITGKNFKQTQKVETITHNQMTKDIPIISWEKNQITCLMPTASVSYNEDLTQIYGKGINIYLNDSGERTMIGRFEYITPTYITDVTQK